jgi:hypothetical protein
VSDSYTLTDQIEIVSLAVKDPNGNPVPFGSVTVTDGPETQTVSISGGTATATFTFPLFGGPGEQPGTHNLSVNFGGSVTPFTAPSSYPGYYFQILFDLLLVDAFLNGGG